MSMAIRRLQFAQSWQAEPHSFLLARAPARLSAFSIQSSARHWNSEIQEHKEGISAVILYPMNALAEDQLSRLRELLCGVGISFGLYVGKTPQWASDVTGFRLPQGASRADYAAKVAELHSQGHPGAVHPPEECASREEMQAPESAPDSADQRKAARTVAHAAAGHRDVRWSASGFSGCGRGAHLFGRKRSRDSLPLAAVEELLREERRRDSVHRHFSHHCRSQRPGTRCPFRIEVLWRRRRTRSRSSMKTTSRIFGRPNGKQVRRCRATRCCSCETCWRPSATWTAIHRRRSSS